MHRYLIIFLICVLNTVNETFAEGQQSHFCLPPATTVDSITGLEICTNPMSYAIPPLTERAKKTSRREKLNNDQITLDYMVDILERVLPTVDGESCHYIFPKVVVKVTVDCSGAVRHAEIRNKAEKDYTEYEKALVRELKNEKEL